MKQTIRWIGIATAFLLVVGACGKASHSSATKAKTGSAASDTSTCTPAKVGGTLNYGLLAAAPSLDPYDGGSGPQFEALYGYLTRYNAQKAEYEPEMAESVKANADNSVWTVTLPKGAVFGNGDPYDAAAVKASIENIIAPDSTSRLGLNRSYIKKIDVIDPQTVQFTLDAPWGGFPGLLSGTGGSVSGLGAIRDMNVINKIGRKAFALNPAGGGAGGYELTKFQPPELMEFQAKPTWWKGTLCIQTLKMSVQPGAPEAYDAFKKGELDMVQLQRDPEITAQIQAEQPKTQWKTIWQSSGFLLLFNDGVAASKPPTTDIRVRQAIAYAIDPKVIGERAFGGKGSVGTGLINSNTTTLAQTQGLPYDPEKAKALVNEVKTEKGWDGSIRLIAANNPKANAEAAITAAAMMTAVGFKVNLNASLTIAQLGQQYSVQKDYDVAAFGVIQDDANLWIGFRQWDCPSKNILTGFCQPDMDQALSQLRQARGLDQVSNAMKGVQTVWNKYVPGVPYAAAPATLLWSPKLKGLRFSGDYYPIYINAYMTK